MDIMGNVEFLWIFWDNMQYCNDYHGIMCNILMVSWANVERYFGYRGQVWDIITVGILVNYVMKDVFKNREVSGLKIIVETGKGRPCV